MVFGSTGDCFGIEAMWSKGNIDTPSENVPERSDYCTMKTALMQGTTLKQSGMRSRAAAGQTLRQLVATGL
jgi:hypothetical protein